MIIKPFRGAQLNRTHPLSRGLEFCVIMNEFGSPASWEHVGKKSVAFNGSPAWSRGELVDIDETDYLSIAGASDAPFLGDITLIWFGVVDTGSEYRHFMGKHATTGGTSNPFDFRTDNAAAPVIALSRANDGYHVWRSSTAITLGEQFMAAVTSVDLDADPTFHYISPTKYFMETVSPWSGSGSGVPTGSGADIRIGRRDDGAVQLDGAIGFAMGFSRILSASEITSLYRDPYQMFAESAVAPWFGDLGAAVERQRMIIMG